MAINKIDFPTASTPSYTPDIETDYNNQNENLERVIRGYNGISLTNWDNSTTASQVAAGSVVEANGVFWDITTNTAISTTGASSGVIYLTFDDTVPEFIWTNTAPTWSATLNGWYVSTSKSTGHAVLDWDGATSYADKVNLSKEHEGTSQSRVYSGVKLPNVNFDARTIVFANGLTNPTIAVPPGYIHLGSVNNVGSSRTLNLRARDDVSNVLAVASRTIPNGTTFDIDSTLLSNGTNYEVQATGTLDGDVTLNYVIAG